MYVLLISSPSVPYYGSAFKAIMENINKHLCSFRFEQGLLKKLKRVAKIRATSMTDILEKAIINLPEKGKKK